VAQLVARDPDPCGLLGAGQAAADPRRPLLREQRAARQRELGPEVVQVPEQVVVERDPHANEPFAVIDQQPDVELNSGQLGDRQAVQAFAQCGPADGDGVDAIGLAAIAAAAALARRQPRRDANHALATDEQKPLESSRDVPAVLQRPDPLAAQAASPVQGRGKAASADLDGLLSSHLAGRRADRGDRVRSLVHVRTEHDHDPVPFHLD
jgi:hypothetical protein